MVPKLAYTPLACARIGAVHSVVFAGFFAESPRGCTLEPLMSQALRRA